MKTTLITGATGVLGNCFCREYAKRGDYLIITGRDLNKLETLKGELMQEFSIQVDCFACEMASESSRDKLFEFLARYEHIDRLILVAGNDNQMDFYSYSQDKIITQIRANFESQVCLTNYCLKKMPTGGTILAISSLTAITPMPYFAIYSSVVSAAP